MRILSVIAMLSLTALAGCVDSSSGLDSDGSTADGATGPSGFIPHVLVGVADSGINPYHEVYYREELTAHPCTYIEGMPCDLQPLNLSVGPQVWSDIDALTDDMRWQAAFNQDKEIWESIEEGEWYYIPQTVFIAVTCAYAYVPEDGDICILDDSSMHGTGTTSSIIAEEPDAFIAFSEGLSPKWEHFLAKGIPIDVLSMSIGHIAPLPLAGPAGDPDPVFGVSLCEQWKGSHNGSNPLYFKSSGNEPGVSSLTDCDAGNPRIIQVGGAYAADQSQEVLAYKEPDIVSYFCRPTAQTMSINQTRASYCGTSFSAPTAAGAAAKVVLELRERSGYTGAAVDGFIDPVLGITPNDVRHAINMTASYAPEAQYENSGQICTVRGNELPECAQDSIPLNEDAPWLQWGWGFYDGTVAEDTIAYLLDGVESSKPAGAVEHQERIHEAEKALYS